VETPQRQPTVNQPLDSRISIAKHIIDGSISIDSVEEFEGMIRIFPTDPALQRAFGDLLNRKQSFSAAAAAYRTAAGLYLEEGRLFQSILCKVLEWRIIKPTLSEGEPYHRALREKKLKPSRLNRFFASLPYPEMVAVTNRLARVRVPAGQMVRKIGDLDSHLYLIASGILKDTLLRPVPDTAGSSPKSVRYLTEDDVFGDIYPFPAERFSQSHTEAVTNAELGRISKPHLMEVCRKYPAVERQLAALFRPDPPAGTEKSRQKARRADRHLLPLRVHLKVFPLDAAQPPIILEGYSRDISIGGLCLVMDPKYTNVPAVYRSTRDARIEIGLPGEAMTLNVSGNIVWQREVTFRGERTLALGIAFNRMPPRMSGMLMVFADMLYQSGK